MKNLDSLLEHKDPLKVFDQELAKRTAAKKAPAAKKATAHKK